MNNQNIFGLSILALFVGCVAKEDSSKLKYADANSNQSKGPSTDSKTVTGTSNLESDIFLKTFNQYNMTLAKITEIDPSIAVIQTEYNLIKNSLPAQHDISTFTPFHQITLTRLAFAYCGYFIDNNTNFKSLNYSTLTSDMGTTKLLDQFVGVRTTDNAAKYDGYKTVLLNILNNNAGTVGKFVPAATSVAVEKKNLTKLACTALLSSVEFTML
jgi:hypothetical protein